MDGFTDLVSIARNRRCYRADQLFAAEVRVEGTSPDGFLIESERMEDEAKEKADLLKRKAAMQVLIP